MNLKHLAAVLCVAAVCAVAASPALAVKYVALGDSYSSGTGTRTYYDSGCQKSTTSYPYLIRNAHPTWTFVHAACSGAVTGDVINTQSASLSNDTDWVTYTIGGNDAGFSSVITECALPGWASDCDGAIDDAQDYIENTLPGRLDLVNETIESKSPNATVIAINYPRLFNGTDCNAFTFFSGAEMTRLNATADMLKDEVSAAVTRAGAGFVFANVIPPFVGHAVCDGGSGSATEWINGLSNPIGESYHPKVSGHASGYYPVVKAITG